MSLVMTMVQLVLNNWPRARKKGDPEVPVPLRRGQIALIAYDLKKDGAAKFRKTLVDYAPQDGPDGLVVDANGNLFVARAESRPVIYVYDPDGK